MDQIKSTDADISVGKTIIVWETHKLKNQNIEMSYNVYNTEEALIKMMYEKEFLCVAVSKLYKRELVLKHPYPSGVLFEDLATSYKIIGDAKRISVGNGYIYFWRHRKNSISKQRIDERHIQSLDFAQQQIDYMQENYPNAVKAAKYKYVAKIVSLVPYTLNRDKRSKELFRMLQTKLETYAPEVSTDKEARMDIRLRCNAIRQGYIPAKCVIWVTESIKPFRSRSILKKRGLI